MREYSESHRWIDFRLSLKDAGFEFWRTLGQVEENIWNISQATLPPEDANFDLLRAIQPRARQP